MSKQKLTYEIPSRIGDSQFSQNIDLRVSPFLFLFVSFLVYVFVHMYLCMCLCVHMCACTEARGHCHTSPVIVLYRVL